MTLPRRRFLSLAAAATALPVASRLAWAQAFPVRPVRVIVAFTPGGIGDIVGRLVGQVLQERLGQPFVIENRPGAGGTVGTEAVVKSPPDGYSLILAGANNAINAALYSKLNYNFVRDIAGVGSVMRSPLVMTVHPSLPAGSVPELIAYAKANPGKVNMGSAGNGTGSHVTGELFKMMAGVDLMHVPYRSDAQGMGDLVAGQVQVMFLNMPTVIGHIRGGQLRALAVTTATRSAALPDVPSLGESVPGYEASGWFGLGAPRATPVEVIAVLNKGINASLADPKLIARLDELGSTPMPLSPAEFDAFIVNETEKWAKVIKFAGIKSE